MSRINWLLIINSKQILLLCFFVFPLLTGVAEYLLFAALIVSLISFPNSWSFNKDQLDFHVVDSAPDANNLRDVTMYN